MWIINIHVCGLFNAMRGLVACGACSLIAIFTFRAREWLDLLALRLQPGDLN